MPWVICRAGNGARYQHRHCSSDHGPERPIQTGIGPVPVRRAKLRDRGGDEASGTDGDRITFTSTILPKWARRTKSLDALLPVLYLRGISTGDFQETLSALLGKDAPNLSPSMIGRLKEDWMRDYDRWQRRDLAARHYVYIWADGVCLQARMEDGAACILVVIGATPEGRKELAGFQVGVRESAQSWRELLVGMKARGLSVAPEIVVATAGLDAAKKRGARLGRPHAFMPAQIKHAKTLIEGGESPGDVAKTIGVGRSSLYRALK